MYAGKCPRCSSTRVETTKTWNLVSPLPDKAGRITVTVMGVLKCSDCGYTWRTTISKLKIGREIEIEGEKGKKRITMKEEEERKPYEIILDVDEILKEEKTN